jgi:hypothetical protein
MLPTRARQTLRTVQAFDLITPAGKVYQFPKPTWLQRAAMLFYSFAEPIIVSAVVLTLIYSAGVMAEALEPLASNTCSDQIRSQQDT